MDRGDVTTIEIRLAGPADPELDDRIASQLRRDLLDGGAESVETAHEPAPPGAKAVEGALVALVVKAMPGAVGVVVEAARSLLARSRGRRVTLRVGDDVIELDGTSRENEQRLIDAFLARHGAPSTNEAPP